MEKSKKVKVGKIILTLILIIILIYLVISIKKFVILRIMVSKNNALDKIDNYYVKISYISTNSLDEDIGIASERKFFRNGDKYKVLINDNITYGDLKTGEEYIFNEKDKTYKKANIKQSYSVYNLGDFKTIDGNNNNILDSLMVAFSLSTKVYRKSNLYFSEWIVEGEKEDTLVCGIADARNGYPVEQIRYDNDGRTYYVLYNIQVNKVEDKEFELPNIEDYELVEVEDVN